MKQNIGTALCLAAACTIGAAAQTSTSKSTVETKIAIKDGKTITTVGCLESNPGGGFMLTSMSTGGVRYALVTNDNLTRYLHHTVRVTGKASDQGNGRVEITAKTDVDHQQDGAGPSGESKEEAKGALTMGYLGLKSLKNVSRTCV